MMPVLMFQKRFAPKVATGAKKNTIRPPRKDGKPNVKVGQMLSLREWTDKPYRSKQSRLRPDTVCRHTERVTLMIGVNGPAAVMESETKTGAAVEAFAIADGFDSAKDMFDWFQETHGLPFRGVLICW